MQTATMQIINIKTPVKLTVAKLENYFEQLDEALDTESLAADLLAEKKVEVESKVFDLFDFASALEKLANKDMDGFIAFLRDDYLEDIAAQIFDLI